MYILQMPPAWGFLQFFAKPLCAWGLRKWLLYVHEVVWLRRHFPICLTTEIIPSIIETCTHKICVILLSTVLQQCIILIYLTAWTVPSQVTGVTLMREVRSGAPALRVTWAAPQSDVTISQYQLRYRKRNSKGWTTSTVSGSPPPTVTYLEFLSPGVTYEVQLQAESAIGLGAFSEVQTATAYDSKDKCYIIMSESRVNC